MQKTADKKIKIIVLLTVVLIFAVVCVLVPVGIVLGLFSDEKNLTPENPSQIKPTSIEVVAYFAPPGKNTIQLGDNHSLFAVELNDKDADNFIGNLRVSVRFGGNIKSMLRLSIYHFWTQEGGTTPTRANVKFLIPDCHVTDTFYNVDNALYFCRSAAYDASDGTNGAYILDGEDNGEINFVTGLDQNIRYESTVSLSLMLTANLIQANRMEEFWGGLPVPDQKSACSDLT